MNKNTWKRFNDFQVSDEKEETVMTESFGGYANASAYCLVYLSDRAIQEEISTATQKTQTLGDEIVEIERAYYQNILPPLLAHEVIADNLTFNEEVEEFKFNSLLKNVIELYKLRYDMVSMALQSKTAKSPPTHLNSFGSFLKYDPYCENILKWYILDTVLNDCRVGFDFASQDKYKLRNLKSSPRLFKKLQHRLSSLPKPFVFRNLILSPQEENQLECKLAEYTVEYPIPIYATFLLTSFLAEKWKDACYAVRLILEVIFNEYLCNFV